MSAGQIKNYINLQELTSYERDLLESVNTTTDGVIYVEAPVLEPLDNRAILDEDEIRAFLRSPSSFFPQTEDIANACLILQAHVPHVYYDELYRQRSSISLERVKGVCSKLQGKLKEKNSSFFPLDLYQIVAARRFEKEWMDYFGSDTALAYGLFEEAQKKAFQLYGSRREHWEATNFNRFYPKFLEEIGRALDQPPLQKQFVAKTVTEPLGPLQAPKPELSDGADRSVVRQRNYAYWGLIQELENYLGDTRTPDERLSRLSNSSDFFAAVESLELSRATMVKIRRLAQSLRQARNVDDPHFQQVIRLQSEIGEEASRNGFYFKLSPTYQTRSYEYADVGVIAAGTILGWTVVRGPVTHQEHYKTPGGVRVVHFLGRLLDHKSEALLEEARGNSRSIMKRPGADLASLSRDYDFGETRVNGQGESILVNYEAAQAHLERFENVYGASRFGTALIPGDWLGQLWKELRGKFSMKQLVEITANSTAGHELEHAWRVDAGLPHDEESAMFGNVQFADHSFEALVLLFLSQTNFDEYSLKFAGTGEADLSRLQWAAEKLGLSYRAGGGSPDSWISRVKSAIKLGFNSDGDGEPTLHARAVMDLLLPLALQYGVQGPYGNDELKWVKNLFEKISRLTPYPEVNNSVLRRRIALAYHERFGRELKPVAQLRPLLEVEFQ